LLLDVIKKNNTCKRWWNDEYNPKKYKVLETQLIDPIDVTIDSSDNLYILDRSDSRIYKVDKEGYIFPIVNKHGDHGYSGDDELSIDANINPNFGGIGTGCGLF